MPRAGSFSLLTDFYELTMMQGYFFTAPDVLGVFDMFFRRQPFGGGYAVFAGLDTLLDELAYLSFSDEDIAFLRSLGAFKDEFLRYLISFRFNARVSSIREGTPVFPHEPLLRIQGTLMECQLVESLVLNLVNFQTLVATKASRIVTAAAGRPVLEFGLRRAHGPDGALSASRAAYIGGVTSTSNTLAGKRYGIPVSGTMAHSWVMSFPNESDAFSEYARLYPDRIILLVDTYDTMASGLPNAVKVFKSLGEKKENGIWGIRIDSGDIASLSVQARAYLNKAGLADVKIFVSSDLDEDAIDRLAAAGVPVDAWGVGTRLVTAWNDPALTGVYKITARSGPGGLMEPCMKISDQEEKITVPGMKNIVRFYRPDGAMMADLLILEDEKDVMMAAIGRGEPVGMNSLAEGGKGNRISDYGHGELLLMEAYTGTKRRDAVPLHQIREHRERSLSALPLSYQALNSPGIYPVMLSDKCYALKKSLSGRITNTFKKT